MRLKVDYKIIDYNPNNIKYGIKKSLKNYKPIDLNNYPVRFNLKYETDLDEEEDIKNINENIYRAKKYFRFKKHSLKVVLNYLNRFINNKSSKNKYSTTFYESGILNQTPEYEVEVSLIILNMMIKYLLRK